MPGNGGGILPDARCAVMVVTVTVSDVLAAAVVQFDFKSVADIARIINGVEVVDCSVSDAGLKGVGG
jgi:hypothetical protein